MASLSTPDWLAIFVSLSGVCGGVVDFLGCFLALGWLVGIIIALMAAGGMAGHLFSRSVVFMVARFDSRRKRN
jgi:hypothetical protein